MSGSSLMRTLSATSLTSLRYIHTHHTYTCCDYRTDVYHLSMDIVCATYKDGYVSMRERVSAGTVSVLHWITLRLICPWSCSQSHTW